MKSLPFFTYAVLTMVIFQASAFADESVRPSDFFCQETMIDPPVAFQVTAKSCDTTPGKFAVCQQKVMCTIVSEQERQTIVNLYKMESKQEIPFERLPHDFVSQKLVGTTPEYFPSYVTCQALPSKNGALQCPAANDCKGDYYYNPQPASLPASAGVAPPAPGGFGAPSSGAGQTL